MAGYAEVGSEFWIDEMPNETIHILPEWITKFGDAVLTSSGRSAIALLLKEINPKAKTALLPAYICESVILPFIAEGYSCCFYNINEDLTPDLISIAAGGNVGIFLHMGYFGFQTNSCLSDSIRQLKADSTIIIEDVTHSLFSDYCKYEENDYYIASIRKWIGLPSGGFLASPDKIINSILQNNEVFADIRKEALLLKAQYMDGADEALKQQFLDLFKKSEELLDCDLMPYNIDAASGTIISILDVKELKDKRRANFKMLSEGLKGIKYLEPVFTLLSEDVCPLFYPVYINKNRSGIQKKLAEKNIYCPIHWPLPKQIKYSHLNNAAKIYNEELSIPCDQRYGEDDIKREISAFKDLLL